VDFFKLGLFNKNQNSFMLSLSFNFELMRINNTI